MTATAEPADRDHREGSNDPDRRLASPELFEILAAWGLSPTEAAAIFGASHQTIRQWLRDEPPAAQHETIADLTAATNLLLRHLQRHLIPAVVRQPVEAWQGRSLVELAVDGQTRDVLAACREMFDFHAGQA